MPASPPLGPPARSPSGLRSLDGSLAFEGELSFSVDGPGGSTAGVVRGDGPVLRVRAEDPAAAWDAVVGSAPGGSGALRALADLLHDDALAVEVSGPGGVLATVGRGADSLLGWAATGTRRVQPGRPAALRPLVAVSLRAAVRTRRRPLVVAVVAAAVIVTARQRRSREGHAH